MLNDRCEKRIDRVEWALTANEHGDEIVEGSRKKERRKRRGGGGGHIMRGGSPLFIFNLEKKRERPTYLYDNVTAKGRYPRLQRGHYYSYAAVDMRAVFHPMISWTSIRACA